MSKRMKIVLSSGLSLGLVLVGGGAGWELRGATRPGLRPIDVHTKPLTGIEQRAASNVLIPSLSGLPESAARAALATAGMPPGSVQSKAQAAATLPGVIIGQDPQAGTEVDPTSKVTLIVSSPAKMPAVVGQTETAARAALQKLGAEVRTTQTYVPGKAPGTILSTSPAAGHALTDEATLVVAQAPSSVFLSSLHAVASGCSTNDSETVNGATLSNNLTCAASSGSTTISEFQLNRHISALDLTVGQSDRNAQGYVLRLKVLGDGKALSTTDLPLGRSVHLGLGVNGRLRLSFQVSILSGPSQCCDSPTLVLGSAKLVGAPASIDALTAASQGA